MIYPVTIRRSDGTLKRRVDKRRMSKRHWKQFDKNERGRSKFKGSPRQINKELRMFLKIERVCDQFTYDYGG